MMKTQILIGVLLFSISLKAQVRNSDTIFVSSNTILFIADSVEMTAVSYFQNNGDVHLLNHFNNNGNIELGNGITRVVGNAQQVFKGTTPIDVNKLEIDNSSSLRVENSLNINDTAFFNNGIVSTNGSGEIVFENGSFAHQASDQSHVNAQVNKIGNSAFTFPIGDGTYYRPIGISAPASATDQFEAQYFWKNPDDDGYSGASKDATINHVSAKEYWMLNRTNGSSSVSVNLSWNDSSYVRNLSELRVVRWNGSQWIDHGNSSTTGDSTEGVIYSGSAISNFSPFTFGSTSTNNPLPVSLVNLEALWAENDALITWSTAQEINNSHFEIYVSVNGFDFDFLGRIESKANGGNSSQLINYNFFDFNRYNNWGRNNKIHYLLVQVDFDGTRTEFKPVSLNKNQQIVQAVEVYPNPINSDDQLIIKISGNVDFSSSFANLMNANGQIVKTIKLNENLSQMHINNLSTGIYFLNIVTKGETVTKKLIIR